MISENTSRVLSDYYSVCTWHQQKPCTYFRFRFRYLFIFQLIQHTHYHMYNILYPGCHEIFHVADLSRIPSVQVTEINEKITKNSLSKIMATRIHSDDMWSCFVLDSNTSFIFRTVCNSSLKTSTKGAN